MTSKSTVNQKQGNPLNIQTNDFQPVNGSNLFLQFAKLKMNIYFL